MLNRVTVAMGMALLAFAGSTGSAFAEFDASRDELLIGTFLVCLGLMALLFVAYAIKHALGLDKLPPAEPDSGDHGHH